jgi:hypothetical protein
MSSAKSIQVHGGPAWLRRSYFFLMAAMAFTGFGQLPIFKRYYLADIPGMAWSADYYLTHYFHYLGAVAVLALFTYVTADYILTGRKAYRLTPSAWVRIALLGGLVVTGIFRALKNLPDVSFSPGLTLFFDVSHLGFIMVFGLVALVLKVLKMKWRVAR